MKKAGESFFRANPPLEHDQATPGSNPNPKTPPPPPPGHGKGNVEFPTLPDPNGTPKYRYATCIRVFQNGNKVMEFKSKPMKIVGVDKEHITFYDELGKRTTIYSNDGIIFVQYKEVEQ